jgi:hypothetical protein
MTDFHDGFSKDDGGRYNMELFGKAAGCLPK